MSLADHKATLLSEFDALEEVSGIDNLLMALGPFLGNLRADAVLSDLLDDVARDVQAVHARFVAWDVSMVARVKDLRAEVPRADVDDREEVPELANNTLRKFDAVANAASELHNTPHAADCSDLSTSGKLLFCLQVRLHRVPEELRGGLERRRAALLSEHDHAFREYSMRLHTEAGFALNRLALVIRQLNPRPWDLSSPDSFDETHRNVYSYPSELRAFVHDRQRRTNNTMMANQIEMMVREDLRRLKADLVRRLGSSRSREGVLRTYQLRCEWYDVSAIRAMVQALAEERQKEDRLAEHLALFLFDAGLRPFTRAMLGRLEPDIFEPFPTGSSFYVEAKQYDDRTGARKAIHDGSRQIWSTAHRLRGRFDLREAFLVIFRRGGPLLRFEGPATAEGLVLRPFVIDVAPGPESGSRQRELYDVTVDMLVASSIDETSS